ncbi:ORF6C domain-containing protein [Cytobacillus firmus]|uniref:ORF6C domain-containing protein n=1 Tax=Cytobacillus TaxID=2675230 RepID=UPI00207AD64B|nr:MULTISPECIES: ORF6C domain-containing protein [Cytobacillus]UQX52312.1 ORF6C domain-containing protein [Cytobacillus pseudoceanisediminis]USK40145.1 ORF6C domain-containing protein [Cytobacillus firmus]
MSSQTLYPGEQKRLRNGVTQRVYKLSRNKDESSKLFSALYRDIKHRYNVSSYKELTRDEMLSVINFIENWKPRKIS